MARIFISHSSADNAPAIALFEWLTAQGWDDLFLDLDPVRGIAGGERWARKLHEAANRCEAVVFLISRNWLASEWCRTEFNLAQKLNKRTFGVLVEDIPVADLPLELTERWQVVNLATGSDHQLFHVTLPNGEEAHVTLSASGLSRLREGLVRAGLDPRFFSWPPANDPDRPPYRGLKPLERDDAGIFFGREAPTIEVLDRLRGLAEGAPPRVMVLLGASGSGKSSFLRAGLIPRLERDDRAFLVLPIVRPQRGALTGETGLARALEEAARRANLGRTRAQIAAAVQAGAEAVSAILADIATAAATARDGEGKGRPPALILPIDQGEELFAGEGATEGAAFLTLVRALASAEKPDLILLFTIRSDAFEQLQTAAPFDGLNLVPFSLPPMPRGAYQIVIEGPARRLEDTDRRLAIEPALTEALLADIEAGGGKDALPLLAFTLERLYVEHGGDGDLRLEEYRQLGGIGGSIEAAVESALKAADADPAVPRDRAARLAILRRALVPWLAGIDPETGVPRRRVARLSEIPEESRPLVEHLIAARLLATDVSPETGERTIEPAHEALLRQWGLLQGWLQEDFAALASLEAVKRASRDWDANARDTAWMSHQAGRLEDAESLRDNPAFARYFDATDLAYLAACRAKETETRDRELAEARKFAEVQQQAAERQKQVAQRTRIGLMVASVLAVIAAGLGWYGFDQARLAAAKTGEVEAGSARLATTVATSLLDQGRLDEAALLLLDAAPTFAGTGAPDETQIAFHRVAEEMAQRQAFALPPGRAFQGFKALFFSDDTTGNILRYDGSGAPEVFATGDAASAPVQDLMPSPDDATVTVLLEDRTVLFGEAGKPLAAAGRLPELPPPSGPEEPEKLLLGIDGMVIAARPFWSEDDATSYTDVVAIDARTGAAASTRLELWADDYFTADDGSGYLADYEKSVRVLVDGDTITFRSEYLPNTARAFFRACLIAARADPATQGPPAEIIEPLTTAGWFNRECLPLSDGRLWFSYWESTSAGGNELNYLYGPEGEETSVNDLTRDNAGIDTMGRPFSWIGTSDTYLGMIFDRELLVIDTYQGRLHRRFAEAPGPALFTGWQVAVVEPAAHRLSVFDVVYEPPRPSVSAVAIPPLMPLNKGTCTGYAGTDDLAKTYTLPGGDTVEVGGASMTSISGPPVLTITSGGASRTVQVGEAEGCIQFSPDWKRLLLVGVEGQPLEIFDFDKVRETGSIEGALIDTLPIGARGAFPVDGGGVVVADGGRIVNLWRKDEAGTWRAERIYDGDFGVIYAEPDRNLDALLIIESPGGGSVYGSLYSVPARQKWIDLGNDYKWLGAALTEDGLMAVGAGSRLAKIVSLPRLDALVSEVEGGLSPTCQPTEAGDYATSACWPAWLSQ